MNLYLSISKCGWLSGMQEHMLLHTRQPSTQNNKYPVSYKHSYISWWWAHSSPKHVKIDNFFFFPMPPYVFCGLRGPPSWHGRSLTDFWGWDAHEAQLRCPNGVWMVIEEDVMPGGALNLNSTNLPRPRSPRESSPSRKIPTVEPGIEPGTSWWVVRDSDH